MTGIQYRHPTEDDLVRMTGIFNDSGAELPSHRTLKPDEVGAFTFVDPDFDPNGAWLAYCDGEAIAYADGFVDKERLRYGRTDAYLNLEIMRGHRGKGVEEDLVTKALEYLEGRGVNSALAQYHESQAWRKDLLHGAGFREVRRYYEMVRRGGHASVTPVFPGGVRTSRLMVEDSSDDDISRIADARNESFVDHFNYSPIPVERFRNFLRSGDTVFSATFAEDGGRTIGFALSEDRPPEEGDTKEREGWVAILGVVASHRKQGIGRALLSDSVNWLTEKGVKTIRLLVDAENDKALGMYRSAGFEIESVEVLLSKDLQNGGNHQAAPPVRGTIEPNLEPASNQKQH
jgi:ribosomal protein S18 acetylase RimI-like enzyme